MRVTRCYECDRILWRDTLRHWWLDLTDRGSKPRPMTGFQADIARILDRDTLEVAQRMLFEHQFGKQ
jgi:hypothetical protein